MKKARGAWTWALGLVVVVFVAFSVPPYLSGGTRVPAPEGNAWHYPVLVGHVLFGSIAILTCVVQVWPWFRRRFPVWHRWVGRVYVFGGVLPAGITAVSVGAVSPFGPVNQVGNVLMGSLWLGFTVAGWWNGKQRRFGAHRRWMVRSFALTASIISNRVWAVVTTIVFTPRLDSAFGGSEIALGQAIAGTTSWLGWVLPLVLSQWWLDRAKPRGAVPREAPAARG
ncbi:DUF2306 domain-containing protein [Actinosynnema sp. NPDC020468]|uniref:DUF2306 domain-containing protein n=1 Tax=Actinosynnema sp. NPDC020468 TaxID=3154488 RepID=UPI0033F37C7D